MFAEALYASLGTMAKIVVTQLSQKTSLVDSQQLRWICRFIDDVEYFECLETLKNTH